MANGISQTSTPSAPLGPLWQRELFGHDAIAAFNRVRDATRSGYANFTAIPPTSLNVDITTIYRAITVNGDAINRLAQRQEGLKQESEFELDMKATLELEVKRLEESLAICKREIKNMGIREEIRQYELAELKDLGLVMLVQALREETPEEWRTETSNGDELLEERSGSQSQES